MDILEQTKIECKFGELLTKVTELEIVVKTFSTAVFYVPLNDIEQQNIFSALQTLTKDLYCELDNLDTLVRNAI